MISVGGLCPGVVSVQGWSLSRGGLCPGVVSVQGFSYGNERRYASYCFFIITTHRSIFIAGTINN